MILRTITLAFLAVSVLLGLAHCPVEKTIPAGLAQTRIAADAARR